MEALDETLGSISDDTPTVTENQQWEHKNNKKRRDGKKKRCACTERKQVCWRPKYIEYSDDAFGQCVARVWCVSKERDRYKTRSVCRNEDNLSTMSPDRNL